MAALEALYHKRDKLDIEIKSLEGRKDALQTLIRADWPHGDKHVLDQKTTPASAMVNLIEPTITVRVRGLLTAYREPMTSGEILEKLQSPTFKLGEKANPWALIHGICRRLVEQGFAREVGKDGRKAWVIAK